MGRKDRERYYVGLHQQAHNKLVGMLAIGESRDEGKRTGEDREKIYSYGTFKTYRRAVMRFIGYVNREHPECTSLKKAKRYVNEWLEVRRDNGASAWTLSMEACALAKLYGIPPDSDLRFHAPPRGREDIRRSRVDAKRDRHFSLTNNAELIRFACATGCRRNVLERLRGYDLWNRERMLNRFAELESKNELREDESLQLRLIRETLEMFPDMEYWIYHRRDKGGRSRYAPVRPDLQDVVLRRMPWCFRWCIPRRISIIIAGNMPNGSTSTMRGPWRRSRMTELTPGPENGIRARSIAVRATRPAGVWTAPP